MIFFGYIYIYHWQHRNNQQHLMITYLNYPVESDNNSTRSDILNNQEIELPQQKKLPLAMRRLLAHNKSGRKYIIINVTLSEYLRPLYLYIYQKKSLYIFSHVLLLHMRDVYLLFMECIISYI